MRADAPHAETHRAPNGVHYRIVGEGEPLLLLHGLMVSGAMFDPLVPLLQNDFRMIIPDLRGHGASGDLPGPYDVPSLAADLGSVLEDASTPRCAVLGYSHGGAVAQQLAHTRPGSVARLLLACTYACNVATRRERLEAAVLRALLMFLSPRTLANLIVQPASARPDGEIGPDKAQVEWLRSVMGANLARPMRGAARGLATFDSRPWLADIAAPTLVVGGTHDTGVPQHHFDMLVGGIPGAQGLLIERAGHMLIWTHADEFAQLVRSRWPPAPTAV